MKILDPSATIIIKPITNETDWLKIRNVLEAAGVFLNNLDKLPSYPQNIRLSNNILNYASDSRYYDGDWFKYYDRYTPEAFLDEYQVFFEHRGYKGSYEYEQGDRCWFGKIVEIKDLVTYESSTLVGLEHEFVKAVDNYLQTLEELKEKEKNMKELKWKIERDPDPCSYGYYIYNEEKAQYLTKNGIVVESADLSDYEVNELFWTCKNEIEEYFEELCDTNPVLMYKQAPITIFTEEVANNIVTESVFALAEAVVEAFIDEGRTFTRHDVCKGIRQVVGPANEITYSEWKEVIVEAIESSLDLYDYSRRLTDGKFEYFFDPAVEADEDECEEETVTADSADTVTVGSDSVGTYTDSTPATPDAPATPARHTISAEMVREVGGSPGDTMHIIAVDGMIIFDTDEDELVDEWKKKGSKPILLQTTLKVDKNCNVRLSKYIFDLANMGKWFGKAIRI